MAPPDSVLAQLQAATRHSHHALEQQLDVVATLGSVESRAPLVARFHQMYDGAAALLAPWFPPEERRGLLARHEAPATPRPSAPAIQTRAEALGFRYVIEGSTLGGRIILRRLAAAGADTTGLAFLDPYGAATGAMWRDLVAELERELSASPQALQQGVDGAVKGFAYARACLQADQVAA